MVAAYNPSDGSQVLKTVAGIAYIGVVIAFFVRLFRRRAQQATTEVGWVYKGLLGWIESVGYWSARSCL
jgi:hypothetical protein